MTLAKDNNIKKGEKIIDEINSVVKSWEKYASQAAVREDLKERIARSLTGF